MKYITTINEQEFVVEIIDDRQLSLNGVMYEVDFNSVTGQPVYSLLLDGKSFEAYVGESEGCWQVLLQGQMYQGCVEDEREKRLRAAGGSQVSERDEFHLKAPMPGLVVAVTVAENQVVEKGDVLLILESMKMQNELKSPRTGKVARVRVEAGDRVEQRQTLLSVV